MSKRKRESSSPIGPPLRNLHLTPIASFPKLNLTIPKSHSTNAITERKHASPFKLSPFSQKLVHTSTSNSSIESALSLAQPSNASSVESLSLTDMSTPTNLFKLLRPLQMAFQLSGMLSKKKTRSLQLPMVFNNGILIEKRPGLMFPDTPCKLLSSTSFDSAVSDAGLIGHQKKTARQLLLEFKASKVSQPSKEDVGSLLTFNMKFDNAKKPTISDGQSPTLQQHSPEADDDYHSPVMATFAGRRRRHEALMPIPLENSKTGALITQSAPETRKLLLLMGNNKFASLRTPTTPVFLDPELLPNPYLSQKFGKVESLGKGGFSRVYKVLFEGRFYAVKQLVSAKNAQVRPSKAIIDTRLNTHPISSHLGIAKSSKLALCEEVEVLNHVKLASRLGALGAEHVMEYVDFFRLDDDGYIVLEFYSRGLLDQFLLGQGATNRIDEFRIWKILLEVLQGVQFLHSNGVLHLDLKPANIFIYDEGSLRIGDFGMSTFENAAASGVDREGDREYIAPEILSGGKYGRPADIFSLGLMMVEIAANIYLPQNGIPWQKLRNGDLSDAGKLSTYVDNRGHQSFVNDGKTLDLVVHWMIEPNYENRPSVDVLLDMYEMYYIEHVRRKPAVIYESEFDWASELHEHTDGFDLMTEEEYLDQQTHKSVSELYSWNK